MTDAPVVEASRLGPPAPEPLRARLQAGGAIAWSEPVRFRTYVPDDPAQVPMYLDQRVYQGSSGRVYPLPFIEGIARQGEEREWQAIHLENRYLRLMVLPELGGRIHFGRDKVTGYDFFYRNTVIKPALVGLTGPWVSGGVEFNWPQHHRPGTFLPVETRIEQHEDGSVTVWCGDHDPFQRMAGTHGIRLHPDRAVVEADVRLHNRTSLPQTFLWWANVAVRVHDHYQSFFPQDVRFVADHARRAITAFPAADRPYYGVDYPARARVHPGADRIDYYRNIPVPTSYMIVDSDESFFGGYDHAAGAGVVHWADRRIAPGKKQWTWGNAPFGHAWDRHLTDSDGSYVELMAGVFTDNQPDFSWLQPGEVKRFTQLWYPIPAIGVAHQANADAAVHVDLEAGHARVALAVTRPMIGRLRVSSTGAGVLEERTEPLEPGVPVQLEVALPDVETGSGLVVELLEGDGVRLRWRLVDREVEEPWTASEPPAPEAIATVEELYLTGVHLEQYRHPTRSPLPYWREALRRDPGNARTRLALAERALRAGDLVDAEEHARVAVERLTIRNGNPRDTEAFYLLGLILEQAGREDEALKWFGKATWDSKWVAAATFESARIQARRGADSTALKDLAGLGPVADPRVAALCVLLHRRLGSAEDAAVILARALDEAPLDALLRFLATGAVPPDAGMALDLAGDLASFGALDDALAALDVAAASPIGPGGNHRATALYARAALLDQAGRPEEAEEDRRQARTADRRWCFPSGRTAQGALERALQADPEDTVAASLLGMLLYGVGRRDEAVALWERAIASGGHDPVLHRNAGLGAYNVRHDDAAAWAHYERARALDPGSARLLYEQDQLAERLGHPAEDRLRRLQREAALVAARDDLTVQLARLLTAAGRAGEALALLEGRDFQPWEGGEGAVLGAWDEARAALGLPLADPPLTLGEGRPIVVPPVARREDGTADYFATSLPQLLLFARDS